MGYCVVRDEWIQFVGYMGGHVVWVVVRLSGLWCGRVPGVVRMQGLPGCRVVGLVTLYGCVVDWLNGGLVVGLLDLWVDWWMGWVRRWVSDVWCAIVFPYTVYAQT